MLDEVVGNPNRYNISDPELNSKGTRYVMRVHIHENPPFDLGLIAADVVHNLRAALDNLIFEIHRHHGRPPRDLHFPVTFSLVDFTQDGSTTLDKLPTECFWAIRAPSAIPPTGWELETPSGRHS